MWIGRPFWRGRAETPGCFLEPPSRTCPPWQVPTRETGAPGYAVGAPGSLQRVTAGGGSWPWPCLGPGGRRAGAAGGGARDGRWYLHRSPSRRGRQSRGRGEGRSALEVTSAPPPRADRPGWRLQDPGRCPAGHGAPAGTPAGAASWLGGQQWCQGELTSSPPPAGRDGLADTLPREIVASVQCSSANHQPSWERPGTGAGGSALSGGD